MLDIGKYTNYNGVINLGDTDCTVSNADFEIKLYPENIKKLFFNNGVITGGSFVDSYFKSGNFKGKHFYNSVFRDGIFAGGKFMCSCWVDGEWLDGEWVSGIDIFDRQHCISPNLWKEYLDVKVADKKGAYKNFTGTVAWLGSKFNIIGGELELGDENFYHNFVIFGGTIETGFLDNGIIEGCTFLNGTINNSIWKRGIWHKGTWCGGRSIWKGGYDKNDVFIEYPPEQ